MLLIKASASSEYGYTAEKALAHLDEMDRLAVDPSVGAEKIAKIEAALKLLGQPMPLAGVTALAVFPDTRRNDLSTVAAQVYAEGGRWGSNSARPARRKRGESEAENLAALTQEFYDKRSKS